MWKLHKDQKTLKREVLDLQHRMLENVVGQKEAECLRGNKREGHH